MDESSIYFSQNELSELDFDSLLQDDSSGITKTYGYVKDGEIFYKNISVSDLNSGENLLKHINAPFFESPNRLSLTIKKDSPIFLP
ncbi:MAG: hypothetical protein J6N81_08200 [Treponema sp.]|nr:hypothetical protein [Treponema sp.]